VISPALRSRINAMQVAHLATALDGEPAVVPISFVLQGDRVYSAIDAKPKRLPAERLRRIRHLRANPRAAILVDHYDEDWRRLWWVLLEGPVALLEGGAEHGRAIAALRRKYRQYRTIVPLADEALVIALAVADCRYWSAAVGRQPGAGTARAVRRSTSTRSRPTNSDGRLR